ncbi:TonB-dependent receptor [Quatrionicoccus australiensis]|uniref:TonB-dependent receptor n=1 Tax=Quatrionicoccus australiensis TaxID=138118 RepID=UPI001CFBE159|nr:TonB-dependent siderophore receptor [Quatrionicoccus australiensis]MCB4361800.1 TonB-dependent siderophore receptor [Quatrionicoccus australiensis]
MARLPLAVIAALASLGPAHAETELAPVEVTAGRDVASLGLDQASSSGSRTGVTARELPASIESVDSLTVQERGDYTIMDAITRAAGVSGVGSGGNGAMSFSTRGFTGTNSVGLAEDGMRLSTGSGTQNYPNDSWGYERIDVLRGPASVVYGSGTVGATINAVRKAPSRNASAEALFGIGSDGTGRIGLGGSGTLGEIASFRVDAYAHTTDGQRDLGNASGSKLMTTLRLQPNSDLRFELLADYSKQKPERYWGTPNDKGRIVSSLRDENYNVSDAIISYEDKRLRGRVEWQANDWLSLRDEVYYFEANRHWKNVEQYSLNAAAGTVDRSDYLEIRHNMDQTGNRLEAGIRSDRHRGVVGWEVAQVNFRHSNNSPYGGTSTVSAADPAHGTWSSPDPTLAKFDTRSTLQAFYAEDAWQFADKWLLLAGIRHDVADVSRHELVSGSDFAKTLHGNAWRLGLTYRLNPATSLYAQASAGHDPVTSIITMNLSNSKFTLTKGRQVETGVKQSLGNGRGEWTAALFRIDKDDIITRDPANPALSVQGGSQHSQGIELSAALTPWKNWRVEGNYAVLRARYDELLEAGGVDRAGKRPTDVPEQVANLWLHRLIGPVQASLGGRYVGKRYADNANSVTLPGYAVADAALAWKYDSQTTLRLIGRNLTDKVYATTSYGSQQFVLGQGRSVELVAELKF